MTRANTLTEIWNTYSNNVLNEKAPGEKAAKMGNKPGKGAKNLNDEDAGAFANHDTSGPANAEKGKIYDNVLDPKHNGVEDELYNSEIYSSEKYNENNKKIEKKVKESINSYMKSTFDKLFENVMGEEMGHSDQETQELDALGIDTEVDEPGEGDDITVTLDREMAKSLCDLLQAAMGDEDEDSDDGEEDYESEEGFQSFEEAEEDGEDHDEDEDDTHKEAVEAEDLGHSLVNAKDTGLTNPGHNKVGKLKAKGKKASDSTKKYVEAEPKPLADGKGALTGKDNKVHSTVTTGDYIQ